jgi:excinuclease ABC subunit B
VTPRPTLVQAIKSIKSELKWRLGQLRDQGRLLEAHGWSAHRSISR